MMWSYMEESSVYSVSGYFWKVSGQKCCSCNGDWADRSSTGCYEKGNSEVTVKRSISTLHCTDISSWTAEHIDAVGSSLKSSLLTVIRTVVLFVPLGFVFSRFGLNWFWLTFPVTELLTSMTGAVFYHQFFLYNSSRN